jgi:hypothetical protein
MGDRNYDSRTDPNYGYDVRADVIPRTARNLLGLKMVGQFVKEHPAETAIGIAGAPLLPEGIAGALLAGALDMGGRTIDKTHPLTGGVSDFDTMSAADNTSDIMSHGLTAVPMQYLGSKILKYLGDAADGAGAPAMRSGYASATVDPRTLGAMGSRMPSAQIDATTVMSPLERNAAVKAVLKDAGGTVTPDPQITDMPQAFRDWVPMAGKNIQFWGGHALPAGRGQGFPIGTQHFGSLLSGGSPAKSLDPAFLR